ncbi:unnamed protein product [Urochloa humidicola]
MRVQAIQADTIDAAAERILDELKESSNGGTRSIGGGGREHVIYFDGWGGLGASAVLRAVAQRLAPGASEAAPPGLRFDQIIHIDCSTWQCRRALQRAIADQLSLPAGVMRMFDRQDEEDDFHGIAQGSRTEIPQVLEAMYQLIQKLNHRFLVIFHNGSSQEIDLSIFGFPLFGYSTNKVLWTFQGRFRLKPREKVDNAMKSTGKTDVFLSASRHEKDAWELWSVLVHQEAAEVAGMISTGGSSINQPSQVAECFLYMLKLCCIGYNFNVDYDMATHCCNYWVCDAIIQHTGTDDDHASRQAVDALQLAMPFDADYYNHEHPYPLALYHLVMCGDSRTSVPYWHLHIPSIAIPNADMFQNFDKLSVLKLSGRTFSLSSPPFLYCHSLKFLWLDHCQDKDDIKPEGSGTKEEDIRRCFQRLWVLDMRYTCCDRILSARMLDFMTQLRELNVMGAQDWDIGQLQGRLPNIRKLRVTKSTISCSGDFSENDLFLGMTKMELLDFSGNRTAVQGVTTNLTEMSTISNNCLETVMIVDGCIGIQKLSFRGCAKIKTLLLSGLFKDLCILDLSGTTVKMLDLSAMTIHNLDEIFLDDCRKLCAILWPPHDKRKSYPKKLHIDTTASLLVPKDEKLSSASLSTAHGGRVPSEFDWCISVRDARLLGSIAILNAFGSGLNEYAVHLEISSPAVSFGSAKGNEAAASSSSIKQQHVLLNMDQPKHNPVYYTDAEVALLKDHLLLEANQECGEASTLTWIWPCPRIPSYDYDNLNCYMHVQDLQMSSTSKQLQLQDGEEGAGNSVSIPDSICDHAHILHVHDSLSINRIPSVEPTLGSRWYYLRWCRVERCPQMESVFTAPQIRWPERIFYCLKTFWASELPRARYIWNWNTPTVFHIVSDQPPVFHFEVRSFDDLRWLHLDLCPRVIHVLPLTLSMLCEYSHEYSLRKLETLEMVWCGDLREVFPLYAKGDYNESTVATVCFRNLRRIHLHELPMLQGICGTWRISAPKLETVKIRGCWSLKRLPAISRYARKRSVICDCEKEWWDQLEWDMNADHHPSLYKPIHSRYYKKTSLRGTVLR